MDEYTNRDRVVHYYSSIYPAEKIYKWLRADDRREFKFEYDSALFNNIEKDKDRVIWGSAKTYNNAFIFKTEIGIRKPKTIHIGSSNGDPKTKELVFDIDLDEYDDARNLCCGGEKKACERCWNLALASAEIVVFMMKKLWNFEKSYCFFSGRRGLHLWYLDNKALYLNEKQRYCISSTFREKIYLKNPDHEIIQELYQQVALPRFMSLISDHYNAPSFETDFDQREINPKLVFDYIWVLILFFYLFVYLMLQPKLDNKVTNEIDHFLKSPFSLHFETGIPCYYITLKEEEFNNPFKRPFSIKKNIDWFFNRCQ